jgi:type I restriction enzyme M protein
MISKMRPAPEDNGEGSRIAIVFNGSPLFTGDAGGGESNIRRWIIENDMLEAIIGLPDQLFYNTGIYTYVWIVTNRKLPERRGKVQLINGTEFAWKMKKSLGNKRKRIGDGSEGAPNHIDVLTKLYGDFRHDVRMTRQDIQSNIDPDSNQSKSLFVSKVFANQDFGYLKITVERPLRLNFAVTNERIERFKQSVFFINLVISKKRKDKDQIAKERKTGQAVQKVILDVLTTMKKGFTKGELNKDRRDFDKQLAEVFKKAEVKLDAKLKDALLAPGSLGEKDPSAEICFDKKGEPEPDSDLRDTENVPFPAGIQLPLPLDYRGKKKTSKVDVSKLLELVQDHCEDYLKVEVLPYRPDAWIDHNKIKVGYEIPFNRHFYEYEPPRPLEEIEKEINGLEQEIMVMLKEVTT